MSRRRARRASIRTRCSRSRRTSSTSFIGHFIRRGWRFVSVDELVARPEAAEPTPDRGHARRRLSRQSGTRLAGVPEARRALHDLRLPRVHGAHIGALVGGAGADHRRRRVLRDAGRGAGADAADAHAGGEAADVPRVARVADDATPTRRSSGSRSARSPKSTGSTSRRWRGELVMDWDEIRDASPPIRSARSARTR